MEGERVVFQEEISREQQIRVLVCGEFGEEMLEALEAFVVHKRVQLDKGDGRT